MNWLQRAIKRGVEDAVQRGIKQAVTDFCAPGGGLDAIVERTVWQVMDERIPTAGQLNEIGFVWALRLCFRKHGSSYAEASALANCTLRQYLADEKIRFGDPAYDWTRGTAEEVAEEYELRHWEAA